MPSGTEAVVVLSAYVLGCVVAAYYLVRLRSGHDVRTLGSGNPGARNAGRLYGPFAFTATFALDLGKGAAAVGAGRWMSLAWAAMAAATIAVVVGHVWPAQLGFRGGKGVSVSIGSLLVYDWRVVVVGLAAFLLLFALLRRFTAAGMAAYVIAPIGGAVFDIGLAKVATVSVVSAIVIFAHRHDLVGRKVGSPRPAADTATAPAEDAHGG